MSNGVLVILAYPYGMGALIRSTCNSIWLAQKLGKEIHIHWGRRCLYRDPLDCDNAYPFFFEPPQGFKAKRVFEKGTNVIYPNLYKFSGDTLDVSELDEQASMLHGSSDLKLAKSSEVHNSDICVIYQYLSEGEALAMARQIGLAESDESFYEDRKQIFASYFKPSSFLLQNIDRTEQRLFGSSKAKKVGMHVRSTDKIVETAIPSPMRYLHSLEKYVPIDFKNLLYVATDSNLALKYIASRLKPGSFLCQDVIRSGDMRGSHLLDAMNAKQNGIDVIVDVEMLAKCDVVFAFPQSQIYWWIQMLSLSRNSGSVLIPVYPGWHEWLHAVFYVLRFKGPLALIHFLRLQRGGLLNLFKALSRKAIKKILMF